jgi:signal recognition particle subunit SEC65
VGSRLAGAAAGWPARPSSHRRRSEGRRKAKKMLIFSLKNVVTFCENVDHHFYEKY